MNFKLRNDINARTALVYGGAAFLLVIVGFRSIFATLDPEHSRLQGSSIGREGTNRLGYSPAHVHAEESSTSY